MLSEKHDDGASKMSAYRQCLVFTLHLSLVIGGLHFTMPAAAGVEQEVQLVAELTLTQKRTIDDLLAKALADPRKDAPRSLASIQKIGPGALLYASRETAKLLEIPLALNADAGFDLLLLQVLMNLRHSEPLDEAAMKKLKELSESDNESHADFANEVILIQQSLVK